MNVLYALLIIFLVSIYKSENCDSEVKPKQASDCHNRDKGKDDYKCCYVVEKYTLMGKLTDRITCSSLDEDEYNNIKQIIKSMKQGVEKMGGKFETYDIDCSSNYLFISLLLLMILLL